MKERSQFNKKMQITEEDLHPHLKARMLQCGIPLLEIGQTVNDGWNAWMQKPERLEILTMRIPKA